MPINVKNLSYIYGAGTPFESRALSDVSLTIEDGLITGIMGHTGSGKSTLIQHLNGLLKPTEGDVLVNGISIRGDKAKLAALRREVGLVFQYPEYQLFEETVELDVAFGPKNMGVKDKELTRRVKKAFQMVGLSYETYKDVSPFDLSGGQKRRAAMAGILAMEPKILILDEPTAGLDPEGRVEILNNIRDLHEKHGLTVIIVSHDMECMARLCDRLIVMDGGRVVLSGTPKEVFAHGEELAAIGLSVPPVTFLMQKLKAAGLSVDTRALTYEEGLQELLKLTPIVK